METCKHCGKPIKYRTGYKLTSTNQLIHNPGEWTHCYGTGVSGLPLEYIKCTPEGDTVAEPEKYSRYDVAFNEGVEMAIFSLGISSKPFIYPHDFNEMAEWMRKCKKDLK